MAKPVVWFELLGQHGDNLSHFYRELLGWDFAAPSPPPRSRPARVARRLAALRGAHRAPSRPPWWVTFYTPVPDLDAAIARAQGLGSRVLVPPTRQGDRVLAVISDPEGHPVGLCS